MGRKSKRKVLQFVDASVAVATRVLTTRARMDDALARELAADIARGICAAYAKQVMYVPEDVEFALSARDEQIWSAYQQDGPDGATRYTAARVDQLAVEHGLSVNHVYCIIRLMRKRDFARTQAVLPGFDADDCGQVTGIRV